MNLSDAARKIFERRTKADRPSLKDLVDAEMKAELRRQQISQPYDSMKTPNGDPSDMAMLAMRMRWRNGQLWPFNHVSIGCKRNGDRVVFLISGDEHLAIEDSADLFPSDTLIAQLHVLLKSHAPNRAAPQEDAMSARSGSGGGGYAIAQGMALQASEAQQRALLSPLNSPTRFGP